jgi:cytochrome c peroxidase
VITLLTLTGCLPEPVRPDEDERVTSLAFDPSLPAGSLEVVDDPEVQAAGERLYADTSLSADGNTSCDTCHELCLPPEDENCRGPFDDHRSAADVGVPLSAGSGGMLSRNSPTLRETAFRDRWGWAAQYCTLDVQSTAPLVKNLAYGHPENTEKPEDHSIAVHAVAEAVRISFGDGSWPAAFGPMSTDDDIVFAQVGLALEGFLRTLRSSHTALDAAIAGEDALDDAELRGLELFVGKAHCTDCHGGPLLSDELLHGTAVPGTDPGAAKEGACVRKPDDAEPRGAFLTPPLRNIALTPPYMHDGSLETLDDVVWHYNEGGVLPPAVVGTPDARLQPLSLDAAERADLVAFLRTLGPM